MGRKTLEWVEGCWREGCAMRGVPLHEGADAMDTEVSNTEPTTSNGQEPEEEEEEWDGIMDVDELDGGGGDEVDNIPADSQEDPTSLPSFLQEPPPNPKPKPPPRKQRSQILELVREKVRKVLEDETGFADRRAVTLDQNDFLRLLLAFNNEGIRFRY